ncbi:MAG: hypothetical protein QW165_03380 [Candidatus Woesearchaeota archaeon]
MKTKEKRKAPEKRAKEKPTQAKKLAEKSIEKPAEKPAEKPIDKIVSFKNAEKNDEIPITQEKRLSEVKEDLEKKIKAEKEDRKEKLPETPASYQNTDEKSYHPGYSHASTITYVKTQVIEPAATPAPAYAQPVQPKDAYVPKSAGKQRTPSHLETKLQAIETAPQQISYTRNDAKEKVYSSEKPQSQQSTPSVIDSVLSLNTTSEFSIPEIRVTTPQAGLAEMQNFAQTAQAIYADYKSGQKISSSDLLMINEIKKEIGYKGSCCDVIVIQKYAERKADARKAA